MAENAKRSNEGAISNPRKPKSGSEQSRHYKENLQMKADLLKALGNPVRLCMLRKLLQQPTCTVSYFTSCMEASQSTISQHLAKLRAQGIVSVKKEGTNAYYCFKNELARELVGLVFAEEKC